MQILDGTLITNELIRIKEDGLLLKMDMDNAYGHIYILLMIKQENIIQWKGQNIPKRIYSDMMVGILLIIYSKGWALVRMEACVSGTSFFVLVNGCQHSYSSIKGKQGDMMSRFIFIVLTGALG